MAVEQQHTIADKTLIKAAKAVSAVFTPFSIPSVAFLILFLFSYLWIMPLQYKLIILGTVYRFTILMPTLIISPSHKINEFGPGDLAERKRRYAPLTLIITFYIFCLLTMHRLNTPRYMTGTISATLITMIICAIVNLRWKFSEYMAGVGAIAGGLVVSDVLLGYNSVGWSCISILTAGVLGTVQIILQHHTLGEVMGGFIVGLICPLLMLRPFCELVFRLFNILLF